MILVFESLKILAILGRFSRTLFFNRLTLRTIATKDETIWSLWLRKTEQNCPINNC